MRSDPPFLRAMVISGTLRRTPLGDLNSPVHWASGFDPRLRHPSIHEGVGQVRVAGA